MSRATAEHSADPLAVLRRIRAAEAPGQERANSGAQSPADSAAPTVPERCELCATPVPPEHRHVVNLDSRALLCACRPCSLLFEYPDAALAYRTVPERYAALSALSRTEWDSLEVPVGLAFVFRNSRQDRAVVCYPGPAGVTEADLSVEVTEAFAGAAPDVEAVLIRAQDGGFERFVVPIDVCYALVGHLRTLWRGFDGGPEAHARVAEFFADVERKAVR
ncbi:DUF5947 family protein [Catenulispora rubra]|uniref:DUF5947 family protein n=1 Tax=Catenulispora rubra TaxID=280293 RepID=UPI0018923148|nr:DUF5947 family protein [Catenulispora rubra]